MEDKLNDDSAAPTHFTTDSTDAPGTYSNEESLLGAPRVSCVASGDASANRGAVDGCSDGHTNTRSRDDGPQQLASQLVNQAEQETSNQSKSIQTPAAFLQAQVHTKSCGQS